MNGFIKAGISKALHGIEESISEDAFVLDRESNSDSDDDDDYLPATDDNDHPPATDQSDTNQSDSYTDIDIIILDQ